LTYFIEMLVYLARAPKIWMPRIIKRVFYSEILDRWMSINCTQTTLSLIDDAFGFDNYILKVREKSVIEQVPYSSH